MVNRRNIVICANDVTQIGGISRVIHSSADAFDRRGYTVTLLGMNSINEDRSYVDESDQSSKYRTIVPYVSNPPSRKQDFNKWNRMRGEAVGYMRAFLDTIDISDTIFVILHVYVMEHLVETGVKIGGQDGLAVMGMYHNSFESCKLIGDLPRVQRSYGQATRFLALTELDRDQYASSGMTNASFIYNPVDLLSVPEKRNWASREKKIVYVGRFAKEKNVPWMIRAWASVAENYPDWTFDIYGVGPAEDDIALEILRRGVSQSVRIMGQTQSPESVFANARVMVMASDYEGLPVAVVEAGLCGLPTLTSDCCPGMSVLVNDGVSGYVVPKDDAEAFCARLTDMLDNESLNEQLGINAHAHMERFEPDRVIDDWEALFEFSGL